MRNHLPTYQQMLETYWKIPTSILILIIALIIAAPLCNQIFHCGCTWPLLGLDSHCNFHVQQAPNKCPWCTSLLAAGLSIGSALLAGYCLSTSNFLNIRIKQLSFRLQLLSRVLVGLSAFIAIAYLGGRISAIMQNYPIN